MTEQGMPSGAGEVLGQAVNPHQAITELFKEHARPKIVSGGRASAFLRFTQQLTCTIPSEQGDRIVKIVAHGKPHQAESVRYSEYRVEDSQNPGVYITVKPDRVNSVVQNSERDLRGYKETNLEGNVQSMLSDIKLSNTQFTSEFNVENPSNVQYFHTTRNGDTLVFDVPRMRITTRRSV